MKTKKQLFIVLLITFLGVFSGVLSVYAQSGGSGGSGPGGPYCGDGTCDSNEKCSCSDDCGEGDGSCDGDTGTPYCGDGYCDPDTEACKCANDCGSKESQPSCHSCGDGNCDSDEDYCSCQYDCHANPKVCPGNPNIIVQNCGAGFTGVSGVCVPTTPTTSGTPRALEDTRCLSKTFSTRPNYNLSVSEFNRANRDMCSSGGLFYYTGNSSQVINNRTVESFSGFCSNGETVDTDCTYTIGSTTNTQATTSSSSNTEIGDTGTGNNNQGGISDVPSSQPGCGSAAGKVYSSWNDADVARHATYGSCPNGDGFLQQGYNPVTGFPLSGTSSWNCTTWTVNPAYTAGGYYAVTAQCSLGVNIEAGSVEDSKTILGYPPINPLSSTRCGDASGRPYSSWTSANAARNAKNGTCTSGGNSASDGNQYKQAYSDVIRVLPIVRVNGYQVEELTWNCTGWDGSQYVITQSSCSLQVTTRVNSPIPIITTASTSIVTTSNTSSISNSTTSSTVNPLTSGTSNTDQTYSIEGVVSGGGSGLSGVTVDVMRNGNVILGTVTNANGSYVASGLSAGGYEVRPRNNAQYIFPNTQSVTIVNANVGANFSGLKLTDLDPAVAELLRRSTTDNTTTTDSGTSINDWIDNIINRLGGSDDGGTGTDNIVGGGTSLASGNSFSNIFSENSLISLLKNGYVPLANSYSPVGLSLIRKYANQNSICGDGIKEEGETCDDGINNGKGSDYCSSDCLYFGEVRFTSEGLASDALGNGGTIGNGRMLHVLQVAGNTVGNAFSSVFDGIDSGVNTISGTFDSPQKRLKQKIIENTSPQTRKVMKEVAKYSVAGVVTLLAALAAGLHFMIYKSQWMSYTVQEGDTLDTLGSKFTMTSRALKAKNSLLKKGGLRPGMKIQVRNRHFIEKDYLDQLKSVLKDGLDKRSHGKMTSKIEKIFAKK